MSPGNLLKPPRIGACILSWILFGFGSASYTDGTGIFGSYAAERSHGDICYASNSENGSRTETRAVRERG